MALRSRRCVLCISANFSKSEQSMLFTMESTMRSHISRYRLKWWLTDSSSDINFNQPVRNLSAANFTQAKSNPLLFWSIENNILFQT